jgi:putative transposase
MPINHTDKTGQLSNIFYRRRLPHYQPSEATYFITYRLSGSLPAEVVTRLKNEMELLERSANKTAADKNPKLELKNYHSLYFSKFDALLDKNNTGPRWMKQPEIADLIDSAIRYRDGKEYDLFASTVMPNHVHQVFHTGTELFPGLEKNKSQYPVTRILQSMKWYTALKANKILGRSGPFWQQESYDHVVRDGKELERILYYVINNPVKACLVKDWRDWKWTYLKKGLL